jgi:NADH:ubiquinone oxidoreductase subunit 6 (subunit J)
MRLFAEFFVMILAGGVVVATVACCMFLPTGIEEHLSVIGRAWSGGVLVGAILGGSIFGAKYDLGSDG